MPSASPTSLSLSFRVGRALLAISLLATAGFSLLDLSATLIFRTPWWMPMTVVQLLPILAFAVLAGSGALATPTDGFTPAPARKPRWSDAFGIIGAGLAILWVGALVSALFSPHRAEALINVTGFLGMIAIGVSCAVLLAPHEEGFASRIVRLRSVIGCVFVALIMDSLVSWVLRDLEPGISSGVAIRKNLGPEAWQFSWENFRNMRPFGHPNYTAGAAVLMIPWLAMLAWETRGKARAGWVIATLLAGVLLFSSGSRGGLLGLAAAIGIGALMALWQGGRRLRMLALLALVFGAVLAVANPRMRETLTGISNSEQVPSNSDLERRSMIKAGLSMGSDRWLTGWGAGTTPLVFPAYRGQLGVSLENSFQLHNQTVTAWAEGGLLAVAGAALVLFGLGRQTNVVLRARSSVDGTVRNTAIAAVLSLAGYAVVLATDSQLDVPFFAAAVAVLGAVIWASGHATLFIREPGQETEGVALPETVREKIEDSPQAVASRPAVTTNWIRPGASQITVAVVLLASLGVVVTAIVPKARLRSQLASAFEELDLERGDLFVESLREIAAEFPNDFVVANLRAWADPRIAREQWERSLAINPLQELPHSNLGWLLVDKEPALALEHFKAASTLVPDKSGVYLGQMTALAGLPRDAQKDGLAMLVQECLRNPGFAFSPVIQRANDGKLRSPTFAGLRVELAKIAADKTRPAWVHAEAEDFAVLLDWWEQKNTPEQTRDKFHSPTRRAYFDAYLKPDAPLSDENGPAIWQVLARARQHLSEAGSGPPSPAGPRFEAVRNLQIAVTRLRGSRTLEEASREVPQLIAWVSQGWPINPAAGISAPIWNVRYNRPGYAILMRNTDLPMMTDLHNGLQQASTAYIEGLFPRKGWCLPLPKEPVALPFNSSRP